MSGDRRAMVLRPSAKINLGLRVGPRRDDGFHDLQTLFVSIALADRLTIAARPGALSLVVKSSALAADRSNLVYRAAAALWRDAGKRGEPRGALLTLTKRIPVAAGLGGGSADAAAALVGLNRVWGLRRSRQDLLRVASQLGSDVPFFLIGGAALALGRGEVLYPMSDVSRLPLLIVMPAFGVGTAAAYGWLDEDRSMSGPDASVEGGPHDRIEVGWPTGPVGLANDLEAPVSRRHPEIAAILEACRKAGSRAAAMSGSGSAVFAVFSEAALPRAGGRLSRRGWQVIRTRTLSRLEAERRMGL